VMTLHMGVWSFCVRIRAYVFAPSLVPTTSDNASFIPMINWMRAVPPLRVLYARPRFYSSLPTRRPARARPSQRRSDPKPSELYQLPPDEPYKLPPPIRYGSMAILAFCAMLFVRDTFISLDTVNGSSMAPTLSPLAHETGEQDRIFILKSLTSNPEVQRGDVVTFWKPHKPREISIKRVIAIEGDTVYPRRGYALDPEIVHSRRYWGGWDGLGQPDPDAIGGGVVEVGKIKVPRGHIWDEGDNWRKSYDSCDFGPISLNLLDGRAYRIWKGWFTFLPVGDEREKKGRSRVVHGERLRRSDDWEA
jgi:mitochondrial inner membrane protease subunit 2